MNKKELIEEIKRIINLDSDEYTDGQCLDMVWELLEEEEGECEHLMNPETCISCKDEKDYKPYTNIDNIVNDMLSVGGKK